MRWTTRLLFNPTAGEGGGTSAPPPAPAEDPIKAILAEKVAEARALKEQLDAVARSQAEREAAAEAQRLKLLADKEGAEKALEEQRQAWERKAAEADLRAQQAAERHLSAEKGRAIAQALSGKQWLEGGAETAAELLGKDFEARFDAAGNVVVVEKATGLPADKVIADRLAKPPFTHLIAASNRGGSGATNPPPPGGGPANNATLAERLKALGAKYQSVPQG